MRTTVGDIAITNGPAVSPDGRLLYFVDTLRGTIESAEILGDGLLGDRRPYARIDPKDGHPDGPTIDSEGCIWISLYAGWEAWRYAPSGELLTAFVLWRHRKSFGGDDLRPHMQRPSPDAQHRGYASLKSGTSSNSASRFPGFPARSSAYSLAGN
jgi:sugar lactone lactonase YvrE